MTLTQKDLDEIEKLINEKFDSKFNEKFGLLPTKHEFFKAMDKLMGELSKMREVYEIIGPQVVNLKTRVESLENIHPNNKHPHNLFSK